MHPILDEYLNDYPAIRILLRGDSGFATPDLYKQCEENGTSYIIRLKENGILRGKASHLVDELDEITGNNNVDYAVVYGEFMYKAGSWFCERRVVCKVEKPEPSASLHNLTEISGAATIENHSAFEIPF